MPVDPETMMDPESTESLLTLAERNVKAGRQGEKEMFEIRNPKTGERAFVTRQNMRDRVNIDGWTVVPKDEGPPAPEAAKAPEPKAEDEIGEKVEDNREPTELDILRDKYKEVSGNDADKRWGKKALQEKIDFHSDE